MQITVKMHTLQSYQLHIRITYIIILEHAPATNDLVRRQLSPAKSHNNRSKKMQLHNTATCKLTTPTHPMPFAYKSLVFTEKMEHICKLSAAAVSTANVCIHSQKKEALTRCAYMLCVFCMAVSACLAKVHV